MEIEDFYGSIVKSNLVIPEQHNRSYISFSCLDPGYYEIVAYTKTDSGLVAKDRTSVAVVENTDFIDTNDTSIFGINTHISAEFHRNDVELLADEVYKLGVKNIRDNYSWARVSKEEGVIDIPKTFVTELGRLGIGAIMLGGFNNSVYMEEGVKIPITDKSINAFADYCKEVVDTFAENGNPLTEFEVWNEYWSWDLSQDSAKNYGNLFNAVYNKLNPSYPTLKMAIGFVNNAAGYNQWNDKVLKENGVKDKLGLATVHAYAGVDNMTNPGESRPEVIGKIKSSMDDLKTTLADNGMSDMEISLTETGYSALPIDVNGDTIYSEKNPSNSRKICVTEKEAGLFLPRCVLLGLANGAKDVYPYQLTDGEYDITDHESFFGLLRGDETVCGLYSPKPQYVSYAALVRALDGTRFDSVREVGTKYCYLFKGNGKTVSAVYDSHNNSTVTVTATAPFTVTDLMGKRVSYEAGTHTFDIGASVIYITGDVEITL